MEASGAWLKCCGARTDGAAKSFSTKTPGTTRSSATTADMVDRFDVIMAVLADPERVNFDATYSDW